eukprot:5514933-Prymnesium_polylepis.1
MHEHARYTRHATFKPGNYPPVTIHGYDYELATDIAITMSLSRCKLGINRQLCRFAQSARCLPQCLK